MKLGIGNIYKYDYFLKGDKEFGEFVDIEFGFNNSKEHINFLSTFITAPQLLNSPQ